MKTSILTVLAYFVMMSVGYASDVYITQSGASLTANINQDGQTNKFGDSTTAVTLTGDNQTLDVDQIGNTITIAAWVRHKHSHLNKKVTVIRLLFRLVLTLRQQTTVLFKLLLVVKTPQQLMWAIVQPPVMQTLI